MFSIAEYEVSGEYDYERNRFKGEWILEDYINAYPDVEVIAWQPMPDPYNPDERHDCETCRYNNRTWDMEPCDGCTIGGVDSKWELKDE